jgi:PAS domain S-box-containing protein
MIVLSSGSTNELAPMQPEPLQTVHHNTLNQNTIISMVLVYAAFSGLWILLSDTVLEWFITDTAQIILVGMIKGWVYIVLSSLLLYVLMHRLIDRDSAARTQTMHSRRFVMLFTLLAAIIIALTSAGIIHNYLSHKKNTLTRLQTIAELKSREVRFWITEREADASFIQTSQYLADQYRRWEQTGSPDAIERIKLRLEQFCKDWRFTAVTLVNPAGKIIWGNAPSSDIEDTRILSAARQATTADKVSTIAAFRDLANHAHLDFIVPLSAVQKPRPVFVLHIDLAKWLFSSLKAWPDPNSKGEMLLFRYDNDHIVYLSEQGNTAETSAASMLPETTSKLLSSHIKSGKPLPATLMEGNDFRNIPVIGMLSQIPDTDWFLLAKLDQSELYAEIIQDSTWIVLVGLLSLLITATGLHLLRQNHQLAMAQAIQQSQTERLSALNLLAAIADSSNDAIFAKDIEGRYILFNKAACDFVGKSVNEVLGQDDRAIFPAEQADKLMARGRQIINDNCNQTQEEHLSLPSGDRIFLATKGPLTNSEGKIIGIFGISRDITQLKQTEKILRENEERLRFALDASKDGLFDFDLTHDIAYLSSRHYEITGYQPDQITANFEYFKSLIYPDDLTDVLKIVLAHIKGKIESTDFEFRLVNAKGQILWVRIRAQIAQRDAGGKPCRFVGTMTDITARKEAEESLLKQAEELEQRNAELERFNRATIGRELDMIALKQQINDLSLKLGLPPPYNLSFLEPSLTTPASGDEA